MITWIKDTFRSLSLVQKFSAAVILLILIITTIVSTLIITYQRRALHLEMSNNQMALVRTLAHDAFEPLVFMDPLRLDEIVRISAQTSGGDYALIVDQNGRIVAHTKRDQLGQRFSRTTQQDMDLALREGTEQIRSDTQSGIKKVIVPIKAGRTVIGTAVVGFSHERTEGALEKNLRELKKYVFLMAGAVMLIGVWGAYGLANLLTTRIKRLKETMELVQAGNLQVQVENTYPLICKDLLKCNREQCPAYGKYGCWTIGGTLCDGESLKPFAHKIYGCRNCIVYRKACGDEIGELVVVFNQMVSDLRCNMKKLEAANREKCRLERLSSLGQMAAVLAHEIKNPLNAIQGSASFLRKNFDGELLREYVRIIEEESERLNAITTGFLRFSKPVPLSRSRADLNAIVRNTSGLVRQEAGERSVRLHLKLDDRIPPFSFDAAQIKQVLLNLLVNALDATASQGTIIIATSAINATAVIMVRDTGCGIKQEDLDSIFKPFFTTKTRGSGLGLAIVERIIKEHGGTISVTSTEGQGSTFTIVLPTEGHE